MIKDKNEYKKIVSERLTQQNNIRKIQYLNSYNQKHKQPINTEIHERKTKTGYKEYYKNTDIQKAYTQQLENKKLMVERLQDGKQKAKTIKEQQQNEIHNLNNIFSLHKNNDTIN